MEKLPGQQIAEDLITKRFNGIKGDPLYLSFHDIYEELGVQLNDTLHVEKFKGFILELFIKHLQKEASHGIDWRIC